MESTRRDETASIVLLGDSRDIFEERDAERLTSKETIEALVAREDRPWPEWRRGKALTERQLAKLLEPFKIGPTKVRIGDKALQGYVREDLMDTFRRYLPSLDPEHRNK